MRTFAKSQIRYSKSQRMGIFAFIALIVCIESTSFFLSRANETDHRVEIPPELISLQAEIDQSKTNSSNQKARQNFNPNALSSLEWQNLGFSEKQVNTILKYKYSLGGNFTSKEQIRDCFVISASKFAEIEPFIVLENVQSTSTSHSHSSSNYASSQYSSYSKERPKINYSKFNPNEYVLSDWMRIGFSEKQAKSILKYKRSLGGNFTSLAQIQDSYVISEEKFQEMKPYIVLSSKVENTIELKTVTGVPNVPSEKKLEKFNPNDLAKEDWMALGFSEKQVNTIMNYKRSLGGKFKNAEILKKCYSISEEKFAELEPYLVFNEE